MKKNLKTSFVCQFCNLKFKTLKKINIHLLKEHKEDVKHKKFIDKKIRYENWLNTIQSKKQIVDLIKIDLEKCQNNKCLNLLVRKYSGSFLKKENNSLNLILTPMGGQNKKY